jgi:Fibronectin type III domain
MRKAMTRAPFRLLSVLMLAGAAVLGGCDDGGGTGPDPLLAPTNLQANATSAGSVIVTFSPVADAEGYVVQRAAGTGDFAQVATPAENVFVDQGLAASTTYRYRVHAVRGAETGPLSDPVTVTTSAPPAAPRAIIAANITASRTLYRDTVYVLGAFIQVTDGATLTIQDGTRIEGNPGTALIVMRGARIQANGTAAAPIVMTSSRAAGERQPGDWGGLVIVGRGVVSRGQPVILEGTGTSPSNPAVDYSGGTDNGDSSGSLRYVRIEFAGFGPLQDVELNSLTLAAVGSGTTLENVQSLAGLDDSFEWFGGAVNGRYLVSYESGDDHFDASEGFVGRNQFLIGFQSVFLEARAGSGRPSTDPQGIENDGCAGANCNAGFNSTPYTDPVFANFTLVGANGVATTAPGGGVGMMLRRGVAGVYVNGVVARWPNAAIAIRDAATGDRITSGDLVLRNLLVAQSPRMFETGFAAGSFAVDSTANALQSTTATAASLFTALPTTGTSTTGTSFDWRPAAGSPAAMGGLSAFADRIAARAGTFVTPTAYRGAADPAGARWWEGWTAYAQR